MIERRNIQLHCEICVNNSVSEIKGGKYKDIRKIWLVCKDCKKKIEDTRFNGK